MRVCARVLAAALMAGAVGAALAFPARIGPGDEQHRALTAPPSSLQLTLYMPALPVPRNHAALVVVNRAVDNAPRAEPALAVARPVSPGRSSQPRAAPAPATRPTPTVTRQLASAPPAAAPVASAPAPAPAVRHGHGHAYGHNKQHGKPAPPASPQPATPAGAPPAAEPADMQPPDGGAGPGPDHGNGHANGHDK